MSEKMDIPYISVVLPIYNEEKNVSLLKEELLPVLEKTGKSFEIIAVDDGSKDQSFERLREWEQADHRVRVVRFRRNFGQTAAMSAGFDRARGKIVITMDADLQNDPNDIPKMLDKIEEGYDIVSGWRVERWKEGFLSRFTRRIPSAIANWLISTTTGVFLHDYGCSLKIYRAEVVKNIHLYGDLHRFIPAVASNFGVTIAEMPVNYRQRRFGKSNYGLKRTIRVILDLITVRFLLSFSTRPIHIFGLLGLISGALGVILGAYLAIAKIFAGASLAERPLLLLAILLIMVGVQLVTMGLLGEIVVRTYHETQGKTIYSVREELDDWEQK
jgi:glycosyltransferase involved in cell wall biosynthesis